MSKIGFFGGSFNPPTIAHLEIVNLAIEKFDLDKVVVIPMGDKYEKPELIAFKYRYEMLIKMFENNNKVEISKAQENQEKRSYAIDSFKTIDENYKFDEKYFIMGLDNFINIDNWKDSEKLKKYNYIVFNRNNKNIIKNYKNVKFLNVFKNISSTEARNKLKSRENVENILTKEIIEYVLEKELYK